MALERMEKALAPQPEDAVVADDLYGLALALKNLGRLDEAIERYCEAAALEGRNAFDTEGQAKNAFALGHALVASGDPEGAVECYEAAAMHPQHRMGALDSTAFIYARAGRHEAAAEAMEEAVELSHRQPDRLFNLACIYALAGRREDAVAALGEAFEADPSQRDDARGDTDLSSLKGFRPFDALMAGGD